MGVSLTRRTERQNSKFQPQASDEMMLVQDQARDQSKGAGELLGFHAEAAQSRHSQVQRVRRNGLLVAGRMTMVTRLCCGKQQAASLGGWLEESSQA